MKDVCRAYECFMNSQYTASKHNVFTQLTKESGLFYCKSWHHSSEDWGIIERFECNSWFVASKCSDINFSNMHLSGVRISFI